MLKLGDGGVGSQPTLVAQGQLLLLNPRSWQGLAALAQWREVTWHQYVLTPFLRLERVCYSRFIDGETKGMAPQLW